MSVCNSRSTTSWIQPGLRPLQSIMVGFQSKYLVREKVEGRKDGSPSSSGRQVKDDVDHADSSKLLAGRGIRWLTEVSLGQMPRSSCSVTLEPPASPYLQRADPLGLPVWGEDPWKNCM